MLPFALMAFCPPPRFTNCFSSMCIYQQTHHLGVKCTTGCRVQNVPLKEKGDAYKLLLIYFFCGCSQTLQPQKQNKVTSLEEMKSHLSA